MMKTNPPPRVTPSLLIFTLSLSCPVSCPDQGLTSFCPYLLPTSPAPKTVAVGPWTQYQLYLG